MEGQGKELVSNWKRRRRVKEDQYFACSHVLLCPCDWGGPFILLLGRWPHREKDMVVILGLGLEPCLATDVESAIDLPLISLLPSPYPKPSERLWYLQWDRWWPRPGSIPQALIVCHQGCSSKCLPGFLVSWCAWSQEFVNHSARDGTGRATRPILSVSSTVWL